MREIILDTETTGLDPNQGHRLVEIGCLELINLRPTGKTFHVYINPQRAVPPDATRVHGLTNDFLKDFPPFQDHAQPFLDFIGEDPLVIHNAGFDMKFLNYELNVLGHAQLPMSRAIDTLQMARKLFPGSPANLDALCRRFDIDNTQRTYHGALLDAELLAAVYLELKGGRQLNLSYQSKEDQSKQAAADLAQVLALKKPRPARSFPRPEREQEDHDRALGALKNPLWKQTGSA
jgi:DNA polymerase-3 subunit epsilon